MTRAVYYRTINSHLTVRHTWANESKCDCTFGRNRTRGHGATVTTNEVPLNTDPKGPEPPAPTPVWATPAHRTSWQCLLGGIRSYVSALLSSGRLTVCKYIQNPSLSTYCARVKTKLRRHTVPTLKVFTSVCTTHCNSRVS